MFKALASLIPGKSDTLTVTVAREGDGKLRVNLLPKFGTLDKDAREVISKPICMIGTVEDLDGPDFLAGIERLNTANSTVKEAFEQAEEERKTAAKGKGSSKPAATPAHKPVKSTTTYPKRPDDKKPDDAPKAAEPATEAVASATESTPAATPAPEEETNDNPLGI